VHTRAPGDQYSYGHQQQGERQAKGEVGIGREQQCQQHNRADDEEPQLGRFEDKDDPLPPLEVRPASLCITHVVPIRSMLFALSLVARSSPLRSRVRLETLPAC
jgi:hypothetical protein